MLEHLQFISISVALTIITISYFIFRHHRYNKIKLRLSEQALIKAGKISVNKPQKLNTHRDELIADTAQYLGTACFNMISINHTTEILKDSGGVEESIQETLVFKALERRHSDLDANGVIDKFHHHLSNKTLLKGDLGEQTMAEIRMQEGYTVTFPTNADGTWKSNQEAYDYTIEKDGVILKENPKVGYDENFTTIKEQALEHPDVHYIVGSQHAEAVKQAGLQNITVNPALDSQNIQSHIDGFETQVSTISDETVSEATDLFSFPIFSVAMNSAAQYKLVQEGIVNPGEATMNVVAKTSVKWGGAKAGGLAGAKIGGMVGGPAGLVVGGAIGMIAGSAFGSMIYTAWNSDKLYECYRQELYTVKLIGCFAIDEIEVKKNQAQVIREQISKWSSSHPFQVLFPTEKYVLQNETSKFISRYLDDLSSTNRSIKKEIVEIDKLKSELHKTGFFGRLFGSAEEREKAVVEKSKIMFGEVQKIGIVRTHRLANYVEDWKSQFENIKKEKKKLAA